MTTLELSVVVPCHNEAENLRPLLLAIHAAVDPLGLNFEVVITDDCSSDDSWRILQELAATDRRLRVQRFKFNCGDQRRAGPACKLRAAATSRHSMPIYKTIQKICWR